MKWIKTIETEDKLGNELWFQIHEDDGIFYHNFMFQGDESWFDDHDCWGFKTLKETTDHCLDMVNSINHHIINS